MGHSQSSPRAPPLPPKHLDQGTPISKPQPLSPSRDSPNVLPDSTSLRRGFSVRTPPPSNIPFRNRSVVAASVTSSHTMLGIPSDGRTHRRSRSANTAVRNSESVFPPPPPYSATQEIPSFRPPPPPARSSGSSGVNSQTSVQRAGSRHTNVIITPTPARRSRNVDIEYLRAPMRKQSAEDALETLRKYNTVIVVDDSQSMSGMRWHEARDALAALAEIASQYDTDGIDVYFLNDKKVGMNMRSAVSVKRLFDAVKPRGITPIAERLEQLLLDYMLSLEHAKARQESGDRTALQDIKPINYIVLTDGAPTDDPESVIVAAARRLDAGNFPITQVGIQFVQIGNSPRATEYLQELDDGLASNYGIRDIVDTTPYTGGQLNAEILTKILLGGINRRVDRRGGGSVM